jgi:hypothetical protein
MALPQFQEIVALVRAGQNVAPFQRTPMGLGQCQVIDDLDPGDAAFWNWDRAIGSRVWTQGNDIHGGAGPMVNLGRGSQTFVNKGLEY